MVSALGSVAVRCAVRAHGVYIPGGARAWWPCAKVSRTIIRPPHHGQRSLLSGDPNLDGAQPIAPEQGGDVADELAYRLRQQQLTARFGLFPSRRTTSTPSFRRRPAPVPKACTASSARSWSSCPPRTSS